MVRYTCIHNAVNVQTTDAYVNEPICKEVASLEQASEDIIDGIMCGATMLSSSQSKHKVQVTRHIAQPYNHLTVL